MSGTSKASARRAKITKRTVDAAQPETSRYHVWDIELKGFGFRVDPSGRKVYVVLYRIDGVQHGLTIGEHGSPWTPELARQKAVELLTEVRVHSRDPAKAKQAAREMPTLAGLCELYLAEGTAHKKASTVAADRARITHHLVPVLGTIKVSALAKAHVSKLYTAVRSKQTATGRKPGARKHGRIVVKGGEGAAKQCVMLFSTLMSFAVDRGYRSGNPATRFKKPKGRTMERFLTLDEIARLGVALAQEETVSGNPYPPAAIKLLAFTGCRRGEIETLKWSYVDFERGFLRLPDSKTGQKNVVLNGPALELLRGLQALPLASSNDHVIVGYKPGEHFRGLGKVWERVRARASLSDVRLHDLRHSFASIGAASGQSLPIIGAMLGHRNAVTTQRYAHLSADPVRSGSEAIGRQIATAMNGRTLPDNVVRLVRPS